MVIQVACGLEPDFSLVCNPIPVESIFIFTKEDLEKTNREKFVSKVALGDWDAVIIAQSSFAKIPISTERQIRKIKEEISKIRLDISKEQANIR